MDDEARMHLRALGLGPRASWAQVERTYRALIRRWHPDQFADDPLRFRLANERLVAVVTAYRALKAARDEAGEEEADAGPPAPPPVAARPLARRPSYRLVGQKDVRVRRVPLRERAGAALAVIGLALLMLGAQVALTVLLR